VHESYDNVRLTVYKSNVHRAISVYTKWVYRLCMVKFVHRPQGDSVRAKFSSSQAKIMGVITEVCRSDMEKRPFLHV